MAETEGQKPNYTIAKADDLNTIDGLQSAGEVVSDIQYYNTNGIFAFPSDKAFATYELSELKYLPKSLFYDAATADGVYRGLFAYYVLGGSKDRVKYHKSELTQGAEKITPKSSRNPTAKQIIDVVNGGSKIPNYLNPNSPYRGQIYNVKDFIFCKYYGVLPNNRMVTLRRFAHPTLDSLRVLVNDSVGDFNAVDAKDDKGNANNNGFNKIAEYNKPDKSIEGLGKMQDLNAEYNTSLPVAQLVTFFGGDTGNTLNTILGIDTGLNFGLQTQEPVKNEQTGDIGLMNSPYGDLIKSIISSGNNPISETDIESTDKLLATLVAPEKNINRLQRALLDEAVTAEGPLSKKIFVNLNTVNQVAVRQQGFSGGTNPFTLNFHYTLTSAGEVNSKLLFLDLMTNVLSVGSDYGQFLTPEIRIQQTAVGMGFPGGPAGYVKSITDPVNYIRDVVGKMLSAGNVDRIKAAETAASSSASKIYTEVNQFINTGKMENYATSQLSKSIAVMLSEAFLKKIYYSPLMLSGYPTGEWHLTVGNPLNPIAMMGNLVCNNVKINFNDDLGPDDFPTEMTVSLQLMPGRQRHRGDWESMFNRGNGRLYLGQLVASKESTKAWVNTQGNYPNDTDGKNIYKITQENVDPLTGVETNATAPGQ
jgi:hypothetical protein